MMLEEILDLSWWTIFMFALKAISAWFLAMLVVVLPIALWKVFTE